MVNETLRATVQVAMFCECGMAMQHHVAYVVCPNTACRFVGKRWEPPRFDLVPYVEQTTEEPKKTVTEQ